MVRSSIRTARQTYKDKLKGPFLNFAFRNGPFLLIIKDERPVQPYLLHVLEFAAASGR